MQYRNVQCQIQLAQYKILFTLFEGCSRHNDEKGESSDMDGRTESLFNGVDLDENSFAWHFSPVGLDWNFTRHLALFAEGGVGASGYHGRN